MILIFARFLQSLKRWIRAHLALKTARWSIRMTPSVAVPLFPLPVVNKDNRLRASLSFLIDAVISLWFIVPSPLASDFWRQRAPIRMCFYIIIGVRLAYLQNFYFMQIYKHDALIMLVFRTMWITSIFTWWSCKQSTSVITAGNFSCTYLITTLSSPLNPA
jgi:hypothetical protein